MMAGKVAKTTIAAMKRIVRGAAEGGMEIGRAEIGPDGTVVLIAKSEAKASGNPLDDWLRSKNAGQA